VHGKLWCDVAVVARGTSLGMSSSWSVFLDYIAMYGVYTVQYCIATLHMSLFQVAMLLKHLCWVKSEDATAPLAPMPLAVMTVTVQVQRNVNKWQYTDLHRKDWLWLRNLWNTYFWPQLIPQIMIHEAVQHHIQWKIPKEKAKRKAEENRKSSRVKLLNKTAD